MLPFRRTAEDFVGFDWDERNRETHFQKHGIDFPIVARIEWSSVLKSRDRRVRSEPRWVALAYCPVIDRVLVVVYLKRNRIGRIVSIRLANGEETALFHAR
jgi:uncharacterized DUF497 family protein